MTSSAGHLYFITGIMAAGKSTVSQALAERFERSVHVRGDTFRRSIVGGREEMSAQPSTEAIRQLRLRYELGVTVAQRYAAAGFHTVYQDIAVGPMLDEVVEMFTTRPLAVVVLAPSVAAVEQREREREKTGYTSFSPTDFDRTLQTDTTRLGLWLDTTDMTVEQTVDAILERADPEALM